MSEQYQNHLPGRHGRRGFTLIEILIVAAIISIFAGMAIIGVQQMYDNSKRKGVFDETKQIGSTLSFARDDVGFFPRISMLELSNTRAYYDMGTGVKYLRPGFDNYGILLVSQTAARTITNNVIQNWHGAYWTPNSGRTGMAQGQKGYVKMRLVDAEYSAFHPTDANNEDLTLVNWPSDPWGNPYMFYVVTTDSAMVQAGSNPKGLRLIKRPTEMGNYFTAVVSYGPNGVPGGNDKTTAAEKTNRAEAMLYVKGDRGSALTGVTADFTLKSATASSSDCLLKPEDQTFAAALAKSLENFDNASNDESLAGIRDKGSDDIFWTF